ncbi:hypothetical protein KM043_000066, partial [Ampulex compressa]
MLITDTPENPSIKSRTKIVQYDLVKPAYGFADQEARLSALRTTGYRAAAGHRRRAQRRRRDSTEPLVAGR